MKYLKDIEAYLVSDYGSILTPKNIQMLLPEIAAKKEAFGKKFNNEVITLKALEISKGMFVKVKLNTCEYTGEDEIDIIKILFKPTANLTAT